VLQGAAVLVCTWWGTTPCLSVTDMVNVHKEGSLQAGGVRGWGVGGWEYS